MMLTLNLSLSLYKALYAFRPVSLRVPQLIHAIYNSIDFLFMCYSKASVFMFSNLTADQAGCCIAN